MSNSSLKGLTEEQREALREYQREYRETHKESLRANKREYYKKNREATLRRIAEYRQKNKKEFTAQQAWYRKQSGRDILARNLKRGYGITVDQYWEMLVLQLGCCRICGKQLVGAKEPCVDHCHKTGRVRGLLCMACNKGIGLLLDDPNILRNALKYLEEESATSDGV